MIKKMTAGTFGLTESVIKNDSSERLVLEAGEAIEFTDPETKYCKITFRGSGENAGGYININKYYPVLAGSTAVMELTTPVRLEVELVISAESTLKFDEIEIEELSQPYYLASECSGAKDVLVVVPNYPSLRICIYVHLHIREIKNIRKRESISRLHPFWHPTGTRCLMSWRESRCCREITER